MNMPEHIMASQRFWRCLTGSGSGNITELSSCQHHGLQIDEQDALDRLAETDGAAAAANLRGPSFSSAKVLPLCQEVSCLPTGGITCTLQQVDSNPDAGQSLCFPRQTVSYGVCTRNIS